MIVMILYYFDNSSIHKRTRFYVIIKYTFIIRLMWQIFSMLFRRISANPPKMNKFNNILYVLLFLKISYK